MCEPCHLLGLIVPAEALQERRCQGILHGLVLCSGVLYGRDLLLPPNLCSRMSPGPDLCPRIMSVLLHGPDPWSSILLNLCWGILYGLYGPDLRPCPSLEFLEQGFRWWLTVCPIFGPKSDNRR